MSELNSTRLADSVRIVPIYDRADLVHNTLHTVSHTLLEGLVIVVAVLFLFLGSVRAALLAAITIPLSLLFAFVCMHFAGIPANLLSLGALDFGIIVDRNADHGGAHRFFTCRATPRAEPRRRDR